MHFLPLYRTKAIHVNGNEINVLRLIYEVSIQKAWIVVLFFLLCAGKFIVPVLFGNGVNGIIYVSEMER